MAKDAKNHSQINSLVTMKSKLFSSPSLPLLLLAVRNVLCSVERSVVVNYGVDVVSSSLFTMRNPL